MYVKKLAVIVINHFISKLLNVYFQKFVFFSESVWRLYTLTAKNVEFIYISLFNLLTEDTLLYILEL